MEYWHSGGIYHLHCAAGEIGIYPGEGSEAFQLRVMANSISSDAPALAARKAILA